MEFDQESGSLNSYFPAGCRLCQQGGKMVLFATGLCQKRCFYCPISESRRYRDVVFANERPVNKDEDLLLEARSMNALGTGITGGEPLIVPERVLRFIMLLKETFGNSHHIHLYTAQPAERDILERLADAGLDEIRFHPDPKIWDILPKSAFSGSVIIAKELGMDVGIEIPALPDADHVAGFARNNDIFLNLNELEFSQTNASALKHRGFNISEDGLCSASGSLDIAEETMGRFPGLRAQYCSSCFKDAVQLRKRLLRTAESVARSFDEITPDGTLFYGVIEGDVDRIISRLAGLKVPEDLYRKGLGRIELGWWVLEEISRKIGNGFVMWYEECYPSFNRTVVERIPVDTEDIFL